MASSRAALSQKSLEGDLVVTGKRLLTFPSSVDELLILLEKTERLLAKVQQRPPKSTCYAIVPAMKALMSEQLLCHDDVNVQVAVASCFSEIATITCPRKPYNNVELKLNCESGQNYYRALHTLEMMAKVRATQLMLDEDADGLILEMFQLFLSNIKFNYPSDISGYMETIMTAVIEEGDISFELLSVLLASVKMENKNTSPCSWELGKKVFENCSTKLQSCLGKVVKELNLDVADYAEIVSSLCHDTFNVENMVSKEVGTPATDGGASQLDGLSKSVHENTDDRTDIGNETKHSSESSSEALNCSPPIVQSGTNTVVRRSGRCRKPNSVLRPEEGYQYVWTLKGKYTCEVSSSSDHNKEKNNSASVTELGNAKKKGKRVVAETSGIRLEKEGGMHSGDTSSEGEPEMSLKEQCGGKEIISCEHEDVAHKIQELPMTKPAQAKHTMKDKEKVSNEVVTPTTGGGAFQLNELSKAVHEYSGGRDGTRRSRRCRKPSSVLRPEEGHVWTLKGMYPGAAPSDDHNEEIINSASVSELGNAKKKGKRAIAETSETSSDVETEMLPQEQHGMKERIARDHEDVAHEMEELPMSEPAQAKHTMKDAENEEEFPMSKRAKSKHPMKYKEKVSKEVVAPTTSGGAYQLDGLSEALHEHPDGQAIDGTNLVARRSRRCRKPNSVLRPEEGYQYVWTLKCKYSGEASSESRAIADSGDVRVGEGTRDPK